MPIDRLSAEDELTLRWDGIWPQDIGAIAILDGTALLDPAGRFRIEAVQAAIASRLDLAPRFRQILHDPRRRGLGGTLWIDAPHFDPSDHIKVLPLPPGSVEDDLLRAVEGLRRQRLDRLRPLWEMWFITGLPNRRIGLFVRWHHAIADGMAAMRTIAAFLDTAPDAPIAAARPWTPAPLPVARALLADNVRRRLQGIAGALSVFARPRATVRQVLAAWTGARDVLAGKPGPETSLNRTVGPDRSLAVIRSRLDIIKAIAHTHDATVNDVLLAITAGGLRALLQSRREPVDGVMLPIYVPISLRGSERGAAQGNLIAQMAVPLSLGASAPAWRLRQIAAESAKRKAKSRSSIGTMFRSGIVTRFLLKAIDRQRVNAETADIAGPPLPLYLAGARVLDVFPVLNLIAKISLGVGAVSYAGTFNIGIVADCATCPDMDVLVSGMRDELDALAGSRSAAASCEPESEEALV